MREIRGPKEGCREVVARIYIYVYMYVHITNIPKELNMDHTTA